MVLKTKEKFVKLKKSVWMKEFAGFRSRTGASFLTVRRRPTRGTEWTI